MTKSSNHTGDRTLIEEHTVLILATTLTVLLTIGLLGNACAIFVHLTSRRLRLPHNVFVVSLAITDCVMMLSAPVVIINLRSGILVESAGACLAVVVAFRFASSLEMLTIAAIGFVRYLRIVHPKSALASFTWERGVRGVIAVWAYASFWILVMFLPGVSSYAYNPRMFLCLAHHSSTAYLVSSLVFIYAVSVILIAYSYLRIYTVVRRSRRRIQVESSSSSSRAAVVATISSSYSSTHQTNLGPYCAGRKEWLRMADESRLALQLIVIFVVFVVCWSPYLISTTASGNDDDDDAAGRYPQSVYNFFLVSILFNSAATPVVYVCCNRVYRQELWRLLGIVCGRRWRRLCGRSGVTTAAAAAPIEINTN